MPSGRSFTDPSGHPPSSGTFALRFVPAIYHTHTSVDEPSARYRKVCFPRSRHTRREWLWIHLPRSLILLTRKQSLPKVVWTTRKPIDPLFKSTRLEAARNTPNCLGKLWPNRREGQAGKDRKGQSRADRTRQGRAMTYTILKTYIYTSLL